MVATRGGARTGADVQESQGTVLSQNSTTPAPQARSLRSRTTSAALSSQNNASSQSQVTSTPQSKASNVTRSRKVSSQGKAQDVANTRKTRAATSNQDTAEQSTTRRTRTAKAQPLSPKKNTQLSASQAQKKPRVKATSTSRTIRRKKESDENAPLPQSESKEISTTTPTKSRRRPTRRVATPESDSSMSTRSTTPSDSPMFHFTQPSTYAEDKADAPDDNSELSELESEEDVNIESEDELAGPTTPMRRGGRVQRNGPKQTTHRQVTQAEHSQLTPEPATVSSPAPLELVEKSIVLDELSLLEVGGNNDVVSTIIQETQQPLSMPSTTQETQQSLSTDVVFDSLVVNGTADEQQPRSGDGTDANETIIVEEDVTSSPTGSDHSVIITLQDEEDYEDEECTDLSLTAKTPRPQTIHWENIQPNTVVRANLQMPISPQVDQSQLGIMPDIVLSSPTKREIIAEIEQDAEDNVEFTEFVSVPVEETAIPETQAPAKLVEARAEDDVFTLATPLPEASEISEDPSIERPHYMQPTIASDARRNSMTGSVRTPSRPGTSDSAQARPFEEPWWTRRTKPESNSPALSRRSIAPFTTSTPRTAKPATPDTRSRLSLRVHAKTVAAPKFRDIPAQPTASRTPLRPIGSFTTMTPHPAIPLRGVVAIVEVYTMEGASASAPFIALLHRMGATTTKVWGSRVTHVIFKDGPPNTLQRVFLHNKAVDEGGTGTHIHCVNSRWVSDCGSQETRLSELESIYAVNTGEYSISGKRKRKSMEPSTVLNVEGSLIRSRKSSWGRTASGRFLGSPMHSNSSLDKENARDSASPATPAWIVAPNKLVQATAPLKKVRRLEPAGLDKLKTRRRTLLNE